jgi:hypothetical protein
MSSEFMTMIFSDHAPKTREELAVALLDCVVTHEVDECLLGNVTALEIAALCASIIVKCPQCGATAWHGTNCELCVLCSTLCTTLKNREVPNG